jgi:outer membrane receptor protein involved in Fe transport
LVPSPQILVISQVGNELKATTRGLEIAGQWAPIHPLRFDGSYTAFHVAPHLSATSQDLISATSDGNAPRTQWQLRATVSPVTRATFNAAIFYVGPIEQLKVSAYTRADVNAEWRFTSGLSVMAGGQNLFDAAHAEFAGNQSLLLPTLVPRSASLRLRWTF